jgi:hypothetical protein
MTGGVLRGGRYDLRNASMVDLISTAYNITDAALIVDPMDEHDRLTSRRGSRGHFTAEPRRCYRPSWPNDSSWVHNDTRELGGPC